MTRPFADFEALNIGDTRQIVKRITLDDIRKFVAMTGDDNPLHVDRDFASETPYRDIVVHGMLGASFISTVIGTKLPGPGALWVSQNMDFLLPVRLGDELVISCTVTRKHESQRLLDLDTIITNQNGQVVLQGSGKVRVLEPKVKPSPDAEMLKHRVALVTGGAGGIGEAICRRLAKDGFKVVLNYNSSAEKAQTIIEDIMQSGGDAVAVCADITKRRDAESLLDEATNRFGPVDVLVNNASAHITPKALAETSWDDIQHHLDVQLKGAFFMTQLCAAAMAERKSGRIVNIASQVTRGAPTPLWTGYSVAKAAVAMFTKSMAAELGPAGITVNCVSPGMTETSLIRDIPEKQQMILARQTPLRRLARPEDVAAAVAYLVSDGAAFVTGHTIDVNGGLAML